MKSLAALLMMLNGAVMASENVNTPENRQFLKQQENLSRQLREKPDHQLKAWAEKQVLENPLQRSDNHFLDELVRKQQASQDGKPRQGALYFVSFSIPEEGLKRMLGETRHYGIPATLRGMVNNDLKTTAEAVLEQYCTRTARMELQGSTTWETRTLEYEMSQLPAREVNGQYVVSITSPVTGEIVDAHYSWSRTYLQKSVPMTITVLGTPLSWNAKYSADASFTPVQKTLTAGVAFTSSHPVRVGNTKFKRHTAMKLRLVVRVKKASYTPYVVWSESCPFSKELGKLTKTECTEAGGNRTLVKDGQSYSMYQSCWAYRDTYVTQSADKGTCQTYADNPACTLVSHQCTFYSEEGACLHEYATYSCESKTSGKVMVCGGDVFCLDGECDKAQSGKSNDFAEAVSQLAALAAAGKDVAALNGVDVRAFTGQAKFCKKAAAGYSNCCKDSGWGQDIGLAKCSSDEKALAKAKSNKLTVSVGEFCSKKVLGVCLEKKRSYCQFDSKLAQIVQQQGRNGQLRISFGSAKHPDCRGITVDELQKIQFDRLDFTNFYEDLMNNQKIPDSGVLTQKVKEQIADQLKQAGQ
ncbi:type-F conjugative transfer system mating-pair stabilization protein TraN [Escherichia coli]|nr:type-F conjugative transfer system mating-pair stabilization protein TraN [Escherichia coli]